MSTAPLARSDHGKAAALVVYVLYLLSIPSAGTLALAGVMAALICREGADPVWRAHMDEQIRIMGVTILWWIVLFAVAMIGLALTVVLIGFPVLWLVGIATFVVMLWFTIKSVIGLLALIENRAP